MSLADLDQEVALKVQSFSEMTAAKQARTLRAVGNYKRSFEAAKFNRFTASWTAVDFSPAQELYNDMRVLKTRSRDLYCNSPVINNFVSLLQQNVIGHKGFQFRSTVRNAKGAINQAVAHKIEAAWEDFTRRGNFEITGQYSLVDALDMWVQSLAIDGEILGKKCFGEGKWGFQVQLLHSEQLIVTKHELYEMGIKRDQYGRPLEYCLTNHHPGEGLLRYVYEPAAAILHAYVPYQIGAPRGIPMTTAVMTTIKALDEYRKAELIAARIQASKFVVYTQEQPDALDPEIAMEAALPASTRQNTIQPGMAEVLPPGVDAKWMDPTHPNVAFAPFTADYKREISAGLGISYNNLYSDFQNTSFSSMRAAFIVERAFYRKLQALFIEKVLVPIFEAWIDQSCASGKLGLPPVLGSYDWYKSCEFSGKAYEFSNPLQEAEAQKVLVEERIMSRTQICAERGTTYEQVLDDIAAEQALEKSKGVKFVILPKSSIVMPVPDGASDLTAPPAPAAPAPAPAAEPAP